MKLKYFLRGFGTGVLFATIVLFIAYSYRMSDSQIKEKAKELGMVYAGSTESEGSEATTPEETTTLPEETESEQGTEESSTPEATTPASTTPEATTPEPTTPEETTTEPEVSCVINVEAGTTSEIVSEWLYNAGIIDDAKDFNKYLCRNGYSSNIQKGEYTITRSMSYEEIAELITSK